MVEKSLHNMNDCTLMERIQDTEELLPFVLKTKWLEGKCGSKNHFSLYTILQFLFYMSYACIYCSKSNYVKFTEQIGTRDASQPVST